MSEKLAPVVWSFFTGAMGLDLGLEEQGYAASLAVEKEPRFCETIRLNRPEVQVLNVDVATLDREALIKATGVEHVDLMVGAPPCQSFSTGGSRAALSDPRGNLIFEYLRLVSEVRPKRFVLENVANIVTAAIRHRPISERPGKSWNLARYSAGQPRLIEDDGPSALEPDELSGSAIRLILETAIAEMGYQVRFAVLDSSHYGAPQRRHRFVLVGDRDEAPPAFPEPTHGTDVEPFRTVRDAIGDLEDCPGPGSQYTAATREVFDLVPPGGNWRSLPPDVGRAAMGERSYAAGGGKTGFFRRLAWDEPSPTITGKANRKGSAMCHPSQSRPLSVRECARLQGFPDGWVFHGGMDLQYLQIGNAVPVALGAAVGQMLNADAHRNIEPLEVQLAHAVKTLRATARNKVARQAIAAPRRTCRGGASASSA